MKLYLSSMNLCDQPERFSQLFAGNKKVAIIRNAIDFAEDKERIKEGALEEIQSLSEIGLLPTLLDLRNYFDQPEKLEPDLEEFGGIWVTGGNTFVLRKAMFTSGLDRILKAKRKNADFVYGGYSAGVAVLAPTLRGVHLADDPDVNPEGYVKTTIWEGLEILPYCVAPHYKSDHHESELIDQVVTYFIEEKILFKALADGESIVITDSERPLISRD